MIFPPDGIRPVVESLALSVDMLSLRMALDDYLTDLRGLVHQQFDHMDDPLRYIDARDYLNAVEQMQNLIGCPVEDDQPGESLGHDTRRAERPDPTGEGSPSPGQQSV